MSQGLDRRIPRSSAYFALGALFAMNLLNYVDRYILAAVIERVQESLSINDMRAGILATIFMVSYSVVSPFMGWLGDRMARKYLLAAGVAVWSLATFGSGLANNYGHMVAARSLMGIGEATYAVIAPTLIADLFARKQRSRAMAFFYVAIPVGAALGYVIGGQVEAHFGWRWAFYVVGLPGLAVALSALALREPHRGESEDVQQDDLMRHEALPLSGAIYASLLRNRSFVFNTLGMALMTFALGGLQLWTPKFLSQVRGMELKAANTWLGPVLLLSGLVGTAVGGWLGDRLVGKVRGSLFWLTGLSMLCAVPFITLALVSTKPTMIFLFMGIGLTLVFLNTGPSNTIIVNVVDPKVRAAAFAINIFFIHLLGDIPSPTAMGWVSDLTGSLFWGLAITLPALAASGLLFCLGTRYLDADQESMVRGLRSEKP